MDILAWHHNQIIKPPDYQPRSGDYVYIHGVGAEQITLLPENKFRLVIQNCLIIIPNPDTKPLDIPNTMQLPLDIQKQITRILVKMNIPFENLSEAFGH